MAAKMQVNFYGHVRQYHDLKAEIDKAFVDVMESGQYVMGPTLTRFEGELAKYFGMKHAVGLASRTFKAVASAGVSLQMISQGASEINITFLVDNSEISKVCPALHKEYFGC